MNQVVFGRLIDLLPREAWPHESVSFTPWLAGDIDQLSEAVGIPMKERRKTHLPALGAMFGSADDGE